MQLVSYTVEFWSESRCWATACK